MSKPLIVPVFIPHFGCPHTCVFCNQKKIAGDYQLPSGQLLEDMVQAYRTSSSSKTREVQLAFYGGSFTGLEEAQQRQLLSAAAELKARGLIDKIRLSTRPDYIDEERLTLLKSYQADIIELGVQSMDEAVLKASQRGHTAEDVLRAVEWIRSYPQFALGLQMMVALPADTPAKSLATAEKIAALAPDFVRIYPTAIIKDTALALAWQRGDYEPWPMERILDTTASIWDIFYQDHIPVIRIGLQATDNLRLEQDLLGGAYHPALGEMVKSRWYRNRLEALLSSRAEAQTLTVYCNPADISQFVGQHRANIAYFAQQYQLTLHVVGDERLPRESFNWQFS